MKNIKNMKDMALIVAGVIFSVVAIVHVLRFLKAWPVSFAHYSIPLHWSIYGGIIAALLAIWMFVAVFKK